MRNLHSVHCVCTWLAGGISQGGRSLGVPGFLGSKQCPWRTKEVGRVGLLTPGISFYLWGPLNSLLSPHFLPTSL